MTEWGPVMLRFASPGGARRARRNIARAGYAQAKPMRMIDTLGMHVARIYDEAVSS
jgi:hypothetical protein